MRASAVSRFVLICAFVTNPIAADAGQLKTSTVTPQVHVPPPKVTISSGGKATPGLPSTASGAGAGRPTGSGGSSSTASGAGAGKPTGSGGSSSTASGAGAGKPTGSGSAGGSGGKPPATNGSFGGVTSVQYRGE